MDELDLLLELLDPAASECICAGCSQSTRIAKQDFEEKFLALKSLEKVCTSTDDRLPPPL